MLKRLFIALFFPLAGMAQGSYFEIVYGSTANDFSRSVKQLNSGSIYVFGNSDSGTYGGNDFALSKLDMFGNLIWTKYYGTPNTDNGFYLNTTADGNFVFAGETETASNNLDLLFYKVDTSGNVIWSKSYATPVNENVKYIEQTSDGGYIMAGAQNDSGGLYDILVVKVDANGDYQWHQPLGRNFNDYGDQVHEIPGGYIVTGDTKSYGAGGYDVILYELDTLGVEVWSLTYGDSLQNGCQGLLQVSDGKYLSYGETEIFPASPFDFYLEKVDTGGTSLWRKTYGDVGTDAIFSVREDADGGFVCTGYSNSYNGGAPIDLVIFKVDSAGTFLWRETYGSPGVDIGYELIRSVDNNGFIITGKTFAAGSEQYYLLKLDNHGTLGVPEMTVVSNELQDAYPNPASGLVSFNCKLKSGVEEARLRLMDITGRLLLEREIVSGSPLSLDFSATASGMYFYSLIIEEQVIQTKKLVIGY